MIRARPVIAAVGLMLGGVGAAACTVHEDTGPTGGRRGGGTICLALVFRFPGLVEILADPATNGDTRRSTRSTLKDLYDEDLVRDLSPELKDEGERLVRTARLVLSKRATPADLDSATTSFNSITRRYRKECDQP